jgi:hypothetical protein
VGTIFDDPDATGPSERQDVSQPLRETEGVLGNDCFRGSSERGAKRVKIHPIVTLNINIDGPGTAVNDGIGDDSAGERRKDHLVAFTDPHGLEKGPERVSPTREGDHVIDTKRGGKGRLQTLDDVAVTAARAGQCPEHGREQRP